MTSLLDHPDFTRAHLARMKYARPRRIDRPRGGHHPAGGPGHHGVPVLREHRAPVDHRLPHTAPRPSGSTPTATRCPAWRSGWPPTARSSAAARPVPGLHRRALTARAFDDDGWYRTGDIGDLDDDGYLTITDRKSDIIIRGGENISATEVEEVLLALPGVAEAVVVAAPDARLGEHAAAVLRLRPGHPVPTLERGAGALRAGRPGPAEVAGGAARGRRLPADRERQGPEVRPPCGHCGTPKSRIRFS